MEHIVIKHISGSKANQVETFVLGELPELTLGRDPQLDIRFDPERDELVSRKHAKIEQSGEGKFVLTDLQSRNGVFVNKARVVDSVEINHGDIIQLGLHGPEFVFELDPPPEHVLRVTRVADYQQDLPKPTREENLGSTAAVFSQTETPRAVGRATVERLITQNKNDSRRYLLNAAAILLGVVVLVAGFTIYKNITVERRLAATQTENARKIAEAQAALKQTGSEVEKIKSVMSPRDIASSFSPATVYIEVSWKLVDTVSGRQVYHRYTEIKGKRGEESGYVPTYIRLPDGTVEPWLVTDDGKGKNRPIGGIHTGSGFVVTENGFILTNRHVAASWYTRESPPLPGILFTLTSAGELANPRRIESYEGKLDQWVPAKSSLLGGKSVGPKRVEGRHDTLDVTFPRNKLRIPAKLVRISNEHDVALVKIDTPQAVKKVDLNDNYSAINPGDSITILGYPGVSPKVFVLTKSQDLFNPVPDIVDVPDPTVTPGVIGKVIRGTAQPSGGEKSDYYSESDSYQLTANATGAGNSGGPVFDEYGKVIGIFYAGTGAGADTRITFAVPIKFGMDLMRVSPVL